MQQKRLPPVARDEEIEISVVVIITPGRSDVVTRVQGDGTTSNGDKLVGRGSRIMVENVDLPDKIACHKTEVPFVVVIPPASAESRFSVRHRDLRELKVAVVDVERIVLSSGISHEEVGAAVVVHVSPRAGDRKIRPVVDRQDRIDPREIIQRRPVPAVEMVVALKTHDVQIEDTVPVKTGPWTAVGIRMVGDDAPRRDLDKGRVAVSEVEKIAQASPVRDEEV